MSRTQSRWRLKAIGVGLLVAAAGLAWWNAQLDKPGSVPATFTRQIWPNLRWWLLAAGILGLAALARRWLVRRSPQSLVARMARRSKARDGLATGWDVWRRAGVRQLRARAHVLRPTTYGDVTWWRRRRIPWRELGFRVVKVGGRWVYTSYERMVLFLAPTQAGKTVTMANFVVDARGAVVATTTKVDLVDLTLAAREPIGPVDVFNPEGLGDGSDRYRSTLRWNPIIGCNDPTEARMRSANLIAGGRTMSNVGDREFWDGQAVRVLSAGLHAAAVGRANMLDVLTWVSRPDEYNSEVRAMLRHSPSSAAMIENWSHLANTNPTTRSSITTGIMPALEWLQDPKIAQVALGEADEQFNVEEFLRRKGTLYLMANDREHGGVAPLFSALVASIFEQAKLLATRAPGGRLDPGLSLTLDEVANMCPLPLHRIASDSAGRGITMQLGLQSKSQLEWKWGKDAGKIIWDQAGMKLIFGGYDDPGELADYSALAGERDERVPTYDASGGLTGYSTRRVPVLPISTIRALPEWHVLLLLRNWLPTIGTVQPIFMRKDLKALRAALTRREADTARLAAAVADATSGIPVPRPAPPDWADEDVRRTV